MPEPRVVSVGRDDRHRFSKPVVDEIRLIAGHGVEGDAHAGATVQHRSRVRRDPTQPNLRQVHLIHAELADEVAADGYELPAGALGENVLTRGIALLDLPRGTRLHLGPDAVVEVTGLRNPCTQIDGLEPGLMKRLTPRRPDGSIARLAGVMSIVISDGTVHPGDEIRIELPDGTPEPLEPV